MVIPSVKDKCGPPEEKAWKKSLTEHSVEWLESLQRGQIIQVRFSARKSAIVKYFFISTFSPEKKKFSFGVSKL